MTTTKPAAKGHSTPTKRKGNASAKPEPATITVSVPVGSSPEAVAESLEATVPGWDSLAKAERDELTRLATDHVARGEPVKVKLVEADDGFSSIRTAGKCETLDILRLQKAFAASSLDPVNARANELLNYLGSVGNKNTDRYNAALSFIAEMKPRDQAEALLLVQMYCTHDAAIRALARVGRADWVPQMQTYGNLAAKLLRISQGQMETLARMRRGGEQVVRHIHVDNRGGQAIIAENVQTGGKGNGKIDDQSHATGSAGIGPALLGADPFGNGVPIPCGEGPEAVPDARWHQSRRA